jgi:hypothetical protein
MNASLRALLSGVIDYAGLFPPAKLPLDLAIRNYARYRQEPDAWMLGRFVMPANRLGELDTYQNELLHDGPPFPFSVIGPSEASWAKHREVLQRTLHQVTEFGQRHGSTLLAPSSRATTVRHVGAFQRRPFGRALADVLEVKIPISDDEAAGAQTTVGRLNDVGAAIELAGLGALAVFFEFGPDGERMIAAISEGIALHNRGALPLAGFKLRCGGLEASAFPAVESVASAIGACREASVPLKFTAGLHHPIRRFDASVGTHMHGFINVFVAGVLAHALRLDEDELRPILADEDPSHFTFTDDGLSWKDHRAVTGQIAGARRDLVTSFGSCSFDEPREDLRALGWL